MSDAPGGIVCAGNWIVDLVHDVERWPRESDLVRIGHQLSGIGGGAANVVTDLRHMGVHFPLIPVGKVGMDRFGDMALAHCEAVGLDTAFMVRVRETPTAHTHVMNVAGRSRTFFYQGGTNDTLCSDDIPIAALAATGARLFYLGYLLLLAELDAIQSNGNSNAASVLQAARDAGMQTCVDLVSTDAPDFAAVVWADALPVPVERIVSPVGAGDAFCAGALYAIHERGSPAEALSLAHRVAAASLTGRTATDGIPLLSTLKQIPVVVGGHEPQSGEVLHSEGASVCRRYCCHGSRVRSGGVKPCGVRRKADCHGGLSVHRVAQAIVVRVCGERL